jgi:hypothetical protein
MRFCAIILDACCASSVMGGGRVLVKVGQSPAESFGPTTRGQSETVDLCQAISRDAAQQQLSLPSHCPVLERDTVSSLTE